MNSCFKKEKKKSNKELFYNTFNYASFMWIYVECAFLFHAKFKSHCVWNLKDTSKGYTIMFSSKVPP